MNIHDRLKLGCLKVNKNSQIILSNRTQVTRYNRIKSRAIDLGCHLVVITKLSHTDLHFTPGSSNGLKECIGLQVLIYNASFQQPVTFLKAFSCSPPPVLAKTYIAGVTISTCHTQTFHLSSWVGALQEGTVVPSRHFKSLSLITFSQNFNQVWKMEVSQ